MISGILFELLETQRLLQAEGLEVNVIPRGAQLIATVGGASAIVGSR